MKASANLHSTIVVTAYVFGCTNRVGGGIAPADLPHHRAYGSVPRRFM